MRAQSVAGEPGEVVLVRPRADRGVCVGHRDEIAFPLLRHFIARGGAFSLEDPGLAGNARCGALQLLRRRGPRCMVAREGPEGGLPGWNGSGMEKAPPRAMKCLRRGK